MGLSISAYARHRACDRKAVRKAIDSGRISTLPDGTIDAAQADIDWAANTRPRSGTKAPTGSTKTPNQVPSEGGGTKPGRKRSPESEALVGLRRRLETAKAETAEIDLAERRGLLINKAKVQAQIFEMARTARDAWVNWPPRVAALMAAELGVDQRQMLLVLEKHVDQQLTAIAGRGELGSGRIN
jgi:hypothetical protein